jgi:hypothetical protein
VPRSHARASKALADEREGPQAREGQHGTEEQPLAGKPGYGVMGLPTVVGSCANGRPVWHDHSSGRRSGRLAAQIDAAARRVGKGPATRRRQIAACPRPPRPGRPSQFRDWSGRPRSRRSTRRLGHNRSFRLGAELTVRLPSGDWYAEQVDKEQRWLPVLAPQLHAADPRGAGSRAAEPGRRYPYPVVDLPLARTADPGRPP